MSNLLLRKILSSVIYFALAVVIECYTFASFGHGIFPTYALFDIAMILFISFLIFACPSQKSTNIVICVLLGLQILISYINIIMMEMLNTVLAVKMLTLVAETAEVTTASMFPWAPIIFYAIVIAVLTVSLMFLRRIPVDKSKETKTRKYAVRFAVLIGLVLSMGLYNIQFVTLKKQSKELNLLGDNYLYNTFSDSKQSFMKFGSFCYYIEDVARLVVKPKPLNKVTKTKLEEYLSSITYNPKDSKLWGKLGTNQNTIVIMAESFEWYAITPETTPVLYALANGYDFGPNGEKLYKIYDFANEYSDGTLPRRDVNYDENGNPISLKDDVPIILEDDLYKYGLTLINYYSKAKTDYSEDSVILGAYPFNKSYVERAGFTGTGLYQNVKYNQTLPNVLKDSGYISKGSASYFHTYKQTFYDRNTLIPLFGFDNTKFFEQFRKTLPSGDTVERLSHSIRDSQVVRNNINEFLHLAENGNVNTSKPWLTFFTTVTTHGEFDTYNPRVEKNYRLLNLIGYKGKTKDFSSDIGNENARFWSTPDGTVATYFANTIDTEYMVARLIDGLIKSNQFNNTTLVFYADHNGYYNKLDLNYKDFYYDNTVSTYEQFRSKHYLDSEDTGAYGPYSSERYAVPAFIYATKLDESVVGTDETGAKLQYIEKFTCAYDIPVTIYTMLGIEYNTHYYLGHPVMCTQMIDGTMQEIGTEIIASHTGGYFNNKIFSEDGIKALYKTAEVTAEDIKKFSQNCNKFLEKWYLITALYDNNAFEKVKKTF